MAVSNQVEFEIEGDVAVIRLQRPEALNALNQQMWGALGKAIRRLQDETELRCAILTGSGRAFCVGADLKETPWQGATESDNRQRIERNQQQLCRDMIAAPVPIIVAINGYAVGGGLELTLAADIRIAAEGSEFWLPETAIGRFITSGASILLPRLVGLGQAKRLIYTGERIDAEQALRIGLVDEVVPVADLALRAKNMAQQIAANSPVSVGLAKSVLNRVNLPELENALALETDTLIATYDSGYVDAGVRAFADRGAKGGPR
jgi:enoyl-CoA hydratase